jgi:hypothetical protein
MKTPTQEETPCEELPRKESVASVTPPPPTSPVPVGTSNTTKRKRGPLPIKHPSQLLYVEWEDHHSQDAWINEEEVEVDALLVKSVGWLLKETDTAIILHSNYAAESCRPYSSIMNILKRTIVRRETLLKTQKKRKEK